MTQRTGDSDVLRLAHRPETNPGPGSVRVRQSWAGVNFIDVYHRSGRYPVAAFPAVPGVEAAGIVDAVGDGVTEFVRGQRVAWAGAALGGYSQSTVIPAERAIPLPPHVTEQTAAAVLLRGLTVHMLLHRVRQVARGETILVHAAAGGLGLLLTQWAARLGATVIAVVGDDAKAALAQQAGAVHVVVRRREDFVETGHYRHDISACRRCARARGAGERCDVWLDPVEPESKGGVGMMATRSPHLSRWC